MYLLENIKLDKSFRYDLICVTVQAHVKPFVKHELLHTENGHRLPGNKY